MLPLYLYIVAGFLLAVTVGRMLIPKIILISKKKRILDMPNARKVHSSQIPRLGGVAFFPAIMMAYWFVRGLFWQFNTFDGNSGAVRGFPLFHYGTDADLYCRHYRRYFRTFVQVQVRFPGGRGPAAPAYFRIVTSIICRACSGCMPYRHGPGCRLRCCCSSRWSMPCVT